MWPISGPPPWTITTRTPTRWSRMMSLITALRSSSEIMALPPYLMTMVFPYHFGMYGSASTRTVDRSI